MSVLDSRNMHTTKAVWSARLADLQDVRLSLMISSFFKSVSPESLLGTGRRCSGNRSGFPAATDIVSHHCMIDRSEHGRMALNNIKAIALRLLVGDLDARI